MTRFGMDVVLAHPEGYEVFPEVEAVAAENAKKSGGSFTKTNNMAEAFKDADIVYPKSWAPFARYRDPLYKEASYKPYIIAAMIFLAKFENPQEILKKLEERSMPRIFK